MGVGLVISVVPRDTVQTIASSLLRYIFNHRCSGKKSKRISDTDGSKEIIFTFSYLR
jgi:hypothetical protein